MLKRLRNGDIGLIIPYLEKNEMETTFLTAGIQAFGMENRSDDGRSGEYFGWFEGTRLCGIVGFNNIGICLLHYEDPIVLAEFGRLLLQRQFHTLMGFGRILEPVYELLQGRKAAREIVRGEFLVNRNLKPFDASGVDIKSSQQVDDRVAAAFITGICQIEGQGAGPAEALRMLRRHSEEEYLFLLLCNEIVAQAYVQFSAGRIAQIGGVFTRQDLRGIGCCKMIVAELCQRIIFRGQLPALIVRSDNLPALAAYAAIGFESSGNYLLIKY